MHCWRWCFTTTLQIVNQATIERQAKENRELASRQVEWNRIVVYVDILSFDMATAGCACSGRPHI